MSQPDLGKRQVAATEVRRLNPEIAAVDYRFVQQTAIRWRPAGTWSGERVREALRAWTSEYGKPPRSYEWAPVTGRAMGMLGPDQTPWERDWPRWPSTATVSAHFGSWCEALRAAELPARIAAKDLPLRQRVQDAQRLSRAGVHHADIADVLRVSVATVRAYLGAEPCPRCGGPVVTARLGRGATSCQACAARATKTPRWTRKEVLAAIRAWTAETGCGPRRDDWEARPRRGQAVNVKWVAERERWPSAAEVATVFGSWAGAMREARVPRPRDQCHILP